MVVMVVACFMTAHCAGVGPQQQPLTTVEHVEFIVTQKVGVPYVIGDPESDTAEVDELEEVEGLSEVDGLSTVGGETKTMRTTEAELKPELNLQPVIGKWKGMFMLFTIPIYIFKLLGGLLLIPNYTTQQTLY